MRTGTALPLIIFSLFVLQLPFEAADPVLRVRGAGLSNLELAAALAHAAAAARALKLNRAFDALDWALVALAGAVITAALAAPSGHPAALRTAARVVAGPLLCLFVRAGLSPREKSISLGALACTAGAAILIAAAESLWPAGSSPLSGVFRAPAAGTAGAFLGSGEVVSLAGTAVPIVAAVMLDRGPLRPWRHTWLVLVALGLGAVGRTAGYAAPALGAAVAAFAAAGRRKPPLPPRLVRGLGAALLLAVVAAGLSSAFIHAPPESRLGRALDAFESRPLLGVGPGRLAPDARPNLYLHLLEEGGALSTAAFLAVAAFAATALRRRLSVRRPPASACAGAGILTAWLLNGAFDSLLLSGGPALAFWFALGATTGREEGI